MSEPYYEAFEAATPIVAAALTCPVFYEHPGYIAIYFDRNHTLAFGQSNEMIGGNVLAADGDCTDEILYTRASSYGTNITYYAEAVLEAALAWMAKHRSPIPAIP